MSELPLKGAIEPAPACQIIPGLTFEQYDALPGYNSSLMRIAKGQSLQHAKAYMEGKLKMESDALDFGTAFHELLLRNRRQFIVRPETYPAPKGHDKVKSLEIKIGDPLPWRANAGYCRDWLKDNNPDGLPVMDAEEGQALIAMVEAVRANAELQPFLNGRSEVCYMARRHGILYKCLTDLVPEGPKAPIIDFKKTRNACPPIFAADAIKKGYHVQAALNIDVIAWNGDVREEFWNVAVEDKYPHAISIMKMKDTSPSLIRLGRRFYKNAVALLEGAKKSGEWHGYGAFEPEVYIPGYMIPEFEQT